MGAQDRRDAVRGLRPCQEAGLSPLQSTLGFVGQAYYERAVMAMAHRVTHAHFFIFFRRPPLVQRQSDRFVKPRLRSSSMTRTPGIQRMPISS